GPLRQDARRQPGRGQPQVSCVKPSAVAASALSASPNCSRFRTRSPRSKPTAFLLPGAAKTVWTWSRSSTTTAASWSAWAPRDGVECLGPRDAARRGRRLRRAQGGLTDNGTQCVTWRRKSEVTRLLEQRGIEQIVAAPR